MVGTITLAGTQRLHPQSGKLLGGGKVWLIQAGTTSAPQDGYYDDAMEYPLGRSQCYGVDKDSSRIIVEDVHGIPLNVPRGA